MELTVATQCQIYLFLKAIVSNILIRICALFLLLSYCIIMEKIAKIFREKKTQYKHMLFFMIGERLPKMKFSFWY